MIRKLLTILIRFYQLTISPFLGSWCRFEPSCSEYARQAILLHGVLKGIGLAAFRICRCHPFCQGGVDPVPSNCGLRIADCRIKHKFFFKKYFCMSSVEHRTSSLRKESCG